MFLCERHNHTLHIERHRFNPARHRCIRGCQLTAWVPPAPEGFEQFDHTFTPEQAWWILACLPADSYHWRDIERIEPERRRRFARLLMRGEWISQTYARGFHEHPIRWDHSGLTHGVFRLLACRDTGHPLRSAVQCPIGHFPEILDEIVGT